MRRRSRGQSANHPLQQWLRGGGCRTSSGAAEELLVPRQHSFNRPHCSCRGTCWRTELYRLRGLDGGGASCQLAHASRLSREGTSPLSSPCSPLAGHCPIYLTVATRASPTAYSLTS